LFCYPGAIKWLVFKEKVAACVPPYCRLKGFAAKSWKQLIAAERSSSANTLAKPETAPYSKTPKNKSKSKYGPNRESTGLATAPRLNHPHKAIAASLGISLSLSKKQEDIMKQTYKRPGVFQKQIQRTL
jgi:hypothetical protein